MSLYAVLAYNQYFSRAAALSPSIWVDDDRISRLIRETSLAPDTLIYMDYGSREMKNHPHMRRQFREATRMLLERDIWVESRIVPNGDHCEASWERQVPFFMDALLYEEGNAF